MVPLMPQLSMTGCRGARRRGYGCRRLDLQPIGTAPVHARHTVRVLRQMVCAQLLCGRKADTSLLAHGVAARMVLCIHMGSQVIRCAEVSEAAGRLPARKARAVRGAHVLVEGVGVEVAGGAELAGRVVLRDVCLHASSLRSIVRSHRLQQGRAQVTK